MKIIFIILFAVALPVFAADLDALAGTALSNFVESKPRLAFWVSIAAAVYPVIAVFANATVNPKVSRLLILINKLLQLLTFNTAKNQTDVLTLKEMITNWPAKWPQMINKKHLTINFSSVDTENLEKASKDPLSAAIIAENIKKGTL